MKPEETREVTAVLAPGGRVQRWARLAVAADLEHDPESVRSGDGAGKRRGLAGLERAIARAPAQTHPDGTEAEVTVVGERRCGMAPLERIVVDADEQWPACGLCSIGKGDVTAEGVLGSAISEVGKAERREEDNRPQARSHRGSASTCA